ncbi:unnamed protein product [Tetraodon nigroviridis]|uniref:Plasmolipin n=1 Tax=Tetraodon nigroviridis TaxID=99883 RepID=Q4SKC1_TETNG|nr:unnamed protein product [Tetraodon nigroviridis]
MEAALTGAFPVFSLWLQLLGMIHWALIASTIFVHTSVYGWVMFVAVTLWILTTILFLLTLFSGHRHLAFIPWPLTVMMYNGIAAVLYLTAFLANAASVPTGFLYDGHLGAAAFFGAVVTVAYGVGTFFSYLDWRGDNGNTSTVPT